VEIWTNPTAEEIKIPRMPVTDKSGDEKSIVLQFDEINSSQISALLSDFARSKYADLYTRNEDWYEKQPLTHKRQSFFVLKLLTFYPYRMETPEFVTDENLNIFFEKFRKEVENAGEDTFLVFSNFVRQVQNLIQKSIDLTQDTENEKNVEMLWLREACKILSVERKLFSLVRSCFITTLW
jgi:hypothetical protein